LISLSFTVGELGQHSHGVIYVLQIERSIYKERMAPLIYGFDPGSPSPDLGATSMPQGPERASNPIPSMPQGPERASNPIPSMPQGPERASNPIPSMPQGPERASNPIPSMPQGPERASNPIPSMPQGPERASNPIPSMPQGPERASNPIPSMPQGPERASNPIPSMPQGPERASNPIPSMPQGPERASNPIPSMPQGPERASNPIPSMPQGPERASNPIPSMPQGPERASNPIPSMPQGPERATAPPPRNGNILSLWLIIHDSFPSKIQLVAANGGSVGWRHAISPELGFPGTQSPSLPGGGSKAALTQAWHNNTFMPSQTLPALVIKGHNLIVLGCNRATREGGLRFPAKSLPLGSLSGSLSHILQPNISFSQLPESLYGASARQQHGSSHSCIQLATQGRDFLH
uniref:Uncharacterized protein n=1 Tax=Xenopus tropicalis TaxID=8364 RepID=A0A803J2B1_XENTR